MENRLVWVQLGIILRQRRDIWELCATLNLVAIICCTAAGVSYILKERWFLVVLELILVAFNVPFLISNLLKIKALTRDIKEWEQLDSEESSEL